MDAPLMDRVWRRVERHGPAECWPWRGSLQKGYAVLTVRFPEGRRTAKVSRLVYEDVVGPIPDGLHLDHVCHTKDDACEGGPTCEHRRCLNPRHLEPVTQAENTRRAARNLGAANRAKAACPSGHPYDAENTYVYEGRRYCMECNRIKCRNRRPLAEIHQIATRCEPCLMLAHLACTRDGCACTDAVHEETETSDGPERELRPIEESDALSAAAGA